MSGTIAQYKSEHSVPSTHSKAVPPQPVFNTSASTDIQFIQRKTQSSIIQRKSSCSCGGGCPQCQAELLSTQATPVIQRALIPRPELERLPSTPAPANTSAPQPAVVQMLQYIIDEVQSASAEVERTPSRYEPDLLRLLLDENEAHHRIANTTLNFFLHRFSDVYRLLTDDFRRQVNMEIEDPVLREEEYNTEITDAVYGRYLLPVAQNYMDSNPRFEQRLEQERQRRERRRYRPIQQGEERA